MKKIILLFLLISVSCKTFSQQLGLDYLPIFEKSTWEKFKKGTLYVVLENNGESEEDKIIMQAFKQYWKFNTFEFINRDKYAELYGYPGNFYYVDWYSSKVDENRHIAISNNYAGTQPVGFLYKYPDIFKTQFPNLSPDIYLPLCLKHLQWYCDLVFSGKVKSESDYKKELKRNWHKIKEKPLYILDKYLSDRVKNVDDIKKLYTGEVYVVTEKEIENIIKKNEDINLLFCPQAISSSAYEGLSMSNSNGKYVGVTRNLIYIYNVKTGELIYYNLNVVEKTRPVGVNNFHIKKWNK